MRRIIALSVPALLALASAAAAQSSPGVDPYVAAAPRYYWGYNDPLTGYANLLTAQGQFLQDIQRTKLLAEDVKQKKFETRRKQLEAWDWERKFIPRALEEHRKLAHEAEVRRNVENPPLAEIYSGNALNVLRSELLDKYDRLGGNGESHKVEPEWLEHLHVASPRGGNSGLLKDDNGKIAWPLLVMARDDLAPERTEIETRLNEAKKAVLKGKTPMKEIYDLQQRVGRLQGKLRAEVRQMGDDAPFSPTQYVDAMRSLNELKEALVVLQQPKAAYYLQPLQGKTVAELMTHMRKEGLRFAAATWGDERYYSSLYYVMRDELKRIDGVPTLDAKP